MKDDKRSIQTKQDISKAMIELMSTEKFDTISIVSICEKALVTRATFYKYFEDKYHLISCIVDDCKDIVLKKYFQNYTYSSPKELFIYIARVCIELIEQNSQTLKNIYLNCNNPRLEKQIIQIIDSYIVDILNQQKETVEYKVPIKVISKFYTCGILRLVLSYLDDNTIFTKENIMKFFEYELTNTSLFAPK